MTILANSMTSIPPSVTIELAMKSRTLKAQGINIINLAGGESCFEMPENIKLASIDAINSGHTKYTDVSGTDKLKSAIAQTMKNNHALDFTNDQIIVSNGVKQVIFNLLLATLNPQDEVIIPAPYWVSYPAVVSLLGGNPVILETKFEEQFRINSQNLEQLISDKTKWLILNNPVNPSGILYDEKQLSEIAAVVRKYPKLHVFCDDIYESIIFDNNKFINFANIAPDLKDRIFFAHGVSKTYSMAGMRIGYGIGDPKIIKTMKTIQSQSTSCASSIGQMAALEALSGTQDYIKTNNEVFQKNRDLACSLLSDIPLIDCIKPAGAFYLFPRCSQLFGSKTPKGDIINNSQDFALYLLESYSVMVVPGLAFGNNQHFRLSFSNTPETIIEGMKKIKDAVESLKR